MTTIDRPPPPPADQPAASAADPDRRRRAAVVAAALAGATVGVDLALTTPMDGWGLLAATVAVVAGLVTAGGVRAPQARVVVALALAPAAFLALRASPWLLVPDTLAALALLALGGSLADGGSLLDTRFTTFVRHGGELVVSMMWAPAVVVDAVAGLVPASGGHRRDLYRSLLRGLALSLPLVAVIALTLASGDAVFASLLTWHLPFDHLGDHLSASFVGLWLAAGLLTQARRATPPGSAAPRARLGAIEGSFVLGGLILVYGVFALARLLVALRGDAYVQQTTGLTYAEYARSGFFQLLAAAALTVVVLVVLRSAVGLPTAAARRGFAALAATAVALTLVMVHSAIVRLGLYDGAFGLTMLRLYSTILAWWIGAVLVLVGLSMCGVAPSRSWLPGAVAGSALAVLVLVNAIDPERVVMERNLARAGETGRFDVAHALSLSADARPALVDGLDALDADDRDRVLRTLCRGDGTARRRAEPPAPGGTSWTGAEGSAADARARACG